MHSRFKEILRFGSVGVVGTLVHGGILIGLVERLNLDPVYANLIAFSMAFITSYLGHYYWTYRSRESHRSTALKFGITAVSGLLANYAIFHVMVDWLAFNYLWAFAAVVILIPAGTYLLHKTWAFKGSA